MTTFQETNARARSSQRDMKVRYTAKTRTSGGRRGGVSRSDDGRLDVKILGSRSPRNWYQSGAVVCRWLVSLFRQCDGACGQQDEGATSGRCSC